MRILSERIYTIESVSIKRTFGTIAYFVTENGLTASCQVFYRKIDEIVFTKCPYTSLENKFFLSVSVQNMYRCVSRIQNMASGQ